MASPINRTTRQATPNPPAVSVAATYVPDQAGARRWTESLVERLSPAQGSVVIDVGCGSGASFDALYDHVGRHGAIIGIDRSVDLLERAEEHVAGRGWRNVRLIHSLVEQADLAGQTHDIPEAPEYVLFSQVANILQSRAAVRNVLSFVGGGAIVVAGDTWPATRWQRMVQRTPPWELLASYVNDLRTADLGPGWVVHARAHDDRGGSPPEHRLLRQVAAVLDPLAASVRGTPTELVRPLLARAWQEAFNTELADPLLTDCATALSTGRPWRKVVWESGG
jgi:demethylmenaquinone methyltransferase/2-methoxy-6-polyprenyl-1,4-benzoquinol methylase